MPYGTIKVDQVTFTNASVDQTISVSGIVAAISGNITATGTISGSTIRGTTISGTIGQFGTLTAISGIFTTQISGAVHVAPSGSATAPSVAIGAGTTNPPGIYSPGADQVAISTNGSGRLFVDSSGRVGIGTSPAVTLHVNGSAALGSGQNLSWGGAYGAGIPTIAGSASGLDFYPTGSTTGLNMRLDSNGRLGLGTSSPGARFDVVSADNTAATTIVSVAANNQTSAIQLGYNRITQVNSTPASAYLQLGVSNNTTAVHIDGTGRVGIGTIAPGGRVDISKTGGSTAANLLLTSGGVGDPSTVDPSIQFAGSGYESPGTTKIMSTGAYNARALAFHTGSDGAGTEKVRIDSSGRLLVGTSTALLLGIASSNYAFNIETLVGGGVLNHSIGAVRHGNNIAAAGPVITLARSNGNAVGAVTAVSNGDLLGRLEFVGANGTNFTTTGAWIVSEVDGSTISTSSMPGRLVFSTTADGASSPTERMRITNAGLVLINSTSTSSGRFVVEADAATAPGNRVALFSSTSAGGDATYEVLKLIKTDNSILSTQVYVRFAMNGGATGSGQINGNGSNAAAFGTFSDARLKENIKNLPSQLNNICQLRPVEFDYKDGSGHQIGFIAQEMQQVYPDVIGEDSDGMLTITGWSKTEARLVKALQEAIVKIKALEQRLADAGIA